jgi:hypothetical protein
VGKYRVNGGTLVGKSLQFGTHNLDSNLGDIWNSLFGVDPNTSPGNILVLQHPDREVTWPVGHLKMRGRMRLHVKPSRHTPGIAEVTIRKASRKETTEFVSASGGVNPNVANGGWHEVRIQNLDNVRVDFGEYTITGLLKELKVKLDRDSSTEEPIVRDFKIKIIGATTADKSDRGSVHSVLLWAPETVVTAISGTEYKEKFRRTPYVLDGHTKAKYHRRRIDASEGIDIRSLLDGSNDHLKKRTGPCTVPEP